MPTRHEAVILALLDSLQTLGAEVMREETLPINCPAAGIVNVLDEDPIEVGYRLGSGVREYERKVSLEVIVMASDGASRTEMIDQQLVAIAQILHGSDLGGLVSYLLLNAAENADDIPMQDAVNLRGAVVPVALFYETSDNPMELQT